MLFRRNIEPRCAYCAKGNALNEREVICVKRGIVAAGESCRAFRYDPLKRVPPRPVKLDTGKLTAEDFRL